MDLLNMPININEVKWDPVPVDQVKWDDELAEKTTWQEDLKQGVAGLGNTADTAMSMALHTMSSPFTDDYTKKAFFDSLNERQASRNAWAGGAGKQKGIGGHLISGVSGAPGLIMAPLSGIDEAKNMLDQGESGTTAGIVGGASSAIDTAAQFIPGLGNAIAQPLKRIATQALSGGAANMAAGSLKDLVANQTIENPELAKQYNPLSLERRASEGVSGGIMGPLFGGRGPNKPRPDDSPVITKLREKAAETPQAIPKQLGYTHIDENGIAIPFDQMAAVEAAKSRMNTPRKPDALPGYYGEMPEGGSFADFVSPRDNTPNAPENPTRVNANPLDLQLGPKLKDQEMNAMFNEREAQQKAEAITQHYEDTYGPLEPELAKPRAGVYVPKNQRGAVNMEVFDGTFERVKKLINGVTLHFKGDEDSPSITAYDKNGKQVGQLKLSADEYVNPTSKSNLTSTWVDTAGAPKQGLAPAMYKFASELGDVVPSKVQTDAGRNLWDRMERSGLAKGRAIPRNQRGGINVDEVAKSFKKLLGRNNTLPPASTKTPSNDLLKAIGTTSEDNLIWQPKNAADALPILQQATDMPSLEHSVGGMLNFNTKSLQMGGELSGEKFKNPVLKYLSHWSQWAEKTSDKQIRDKIDPLGKQLAALPKTHRADLMEVMNLEMNSKKLFSEADLQDAGLSTQQLNAYKALRNAQAEALRVQNETNKQLGKSEVSATEAYMASVRHGDYHLPIVDKNGKLVAHYQSTSKRDLLKGLKWMKANVKNANINWDQLEVELRDNNNISHIPKDVLGAYQEMAQLIDPSSPGAQAIELALQEAQSNRGYGAFGQNQRFLTKRFVHGYEGDWPWLSKTENANRLATAQISYLRDAYKWNAVQQALVNQKQVFADPTLNTKLPNTMAMAKELMNNQLGLSKNMARDAEAAIAHILGRSGSSLGTGARNLKTFTALMQLGGNVGYILSAPLQAANSVSLAIRERGLGALSPTVAAKTMSDFAGALSSDIAQEFVHKNINVPMTSFGKEAHAYMVENGIVLKNMFNEQAEMGQNPVTRAAHGTLNATISLPDKVGRIATFLAFAHHLNEMGTYKNKLDLFHRAEELTNMSNVNYRGSERPTMINKLGSMGNLWYMYKAPFFNYYHQLSMFARDAVEGIQNKQPSKTVPFMTHIGMTGILGGALALPLVNEVSDIWDYVKDGMAEVFPQYYKNVSGLGIRGQIIKSLPESVAYGTVSNVTGAYMSGHFTPSIDIFNPIGDIAPIGQELGDQGSTLRAIAHPTSQNITQALWANGGPLIKGNMETRLDAFKGNRTKDGKQIYLKPSALRDQKAIVARTPDQELYRKFGLTELSESKTKELRYINNKEQSRIKKAFDNNITEMFNSAMQKDSESASKYAQAAFTLMPDKQKFKAELNRHILNRNLTPEQLDALRASKIPVLMKLERLE